MMKNALYFTLKARFVLKIIRFLSWFLVKWKNDLIRKIRLISKIMTQQPGQQTIPIHILSIISWSKSNQAMEFGQLLESNMGNILLEKSYPKGGEETIPRPFSKKSKLSISLDWQFKVLCCCCFCLFFLFCLFFWIPSWGLSIYIETKLQAASHPVLFCAWFLRENISFVTFY